jgi:hypothetical protein
MATKRLKDIYEDTVNDLEQGTIAGFPNTKKRQNVTGTVAVNNIKFIPYEQSNTLQIQADVTSAGHRYQTAMSFTDVQYEQADSNDVISFHGTDSKEHYIYAVSAILNNAQVRCTCLDFYFRFANQDYQSDSLLGSPPPPYRRKTTTRPPANPTDTIGMCKHLIKMADKLKDMRILVD